jgi:hypothetical protein
MTAMKNYFSKRIQRLKAGFLLLFLIAFSPVKAQINIAPNATVTASTCNTGPCTVFNDQNYATCGTQLVWISTLTPPDPTPGVNWIEWNWPNPESFDEIVIHHANATTRSLTGGTIQFWNGTSWQNHHTFSNLPQQCINSISFPRLTTNRMRITSFQMTGSGQQSNPNFREIEIFSAPTSPNDAGVASLVAPINFCPGTEDIVVRVQNFGINVINFVTLNWSVNGVLQTPVSVTGPIDTIGGANPFFVDVNLGPWTFLANTNYNIQAWTTLPNGQIDTNTFNDSLDINVAPAITGAFTINAFAPTGGSNFSSFTEFANFVNANGICGPVVVDVAPGSGPYAERIEFEEIQGSSATNTITINGNGNTLTYEAAGTNDRTTLTLDGTSFMTIDSLYIQATGATHGWAVHLTREADNNTIRNCSILVSTTITSANAAGIVASNSPISTISFGNNANHLTIENNVIIGGQSGVAINGLASNNNSTGNIIRNNIFLDQHAHGIYARAQENFEIFGNDISRPNRTNSGIYSGILAQSGMANARIENNRIHSTHSSMPTNTSTYYAIDIRTNTTSMSAAAPLIVANNQIYDLNGAGLLQAIFMSNNDHVKVLHNTINIDVPNASGTANTQLFHTTSTANNCEFKNNILYLNHGGSGNQHLVFVNTPASAIEIDNNAYFATELGVNPNVHVGFHSSTNFSTLSNWQTANAGVYDQNSVYFNPSFLGSTATDFLRPTTGAINSIGANFQNDVPVDYDSVPRPVNPDPGAYQFTPLPCTGAFDFTLDSVFAGGAIFSWQSVSPVSEWQIEWDTCGFVPGSAIGNLDSVVTNNTNYQTALPMGECLCVYVREKCATGGYGPWTGPVEVCVPWEYDLEMNALLSPFNRDCGSDSAVFAVSITNNGTLPASNFDLTAFITGDLTGTISTTFTGTLAPGATDSIVIGTFNTNPGGVLEVLTVVDWVNDSLPDNDSIISILDVAPAGPIQIFSDPQVLCAPGSVMFYVEPAMSSPDLEWVDINNNLLGTGDSIIIPMVDSTFTIRVLADTASGSTLTQAVGPVDNTFGGGGMFTSLSAQSLLIEAYDEVDIIETTIFPDGSGTLLVEIREIPSNTVVHSIPVTVSLPAPGAGVVIPINVTLQPGAYQFGASTTGSTIGLFRNNTGAVYPYGDPNLFEITGNTFNPIFYYYYYNIIIASGSCPREDGELTIDVADGPVADFSFVNSSSLTGDFVFTGNADSVAWDFGGLGTAFGDTASFIFPQADTFEVCVVAFNECGSDTLCQMVSILNISVDEFEALSDLRLFPNPTQGIVNLSLTQQNKGDLLIEIIDLSGRVVLKQIFNNHQGAFNHSFDLNTLSSGMYQLRLRSPDGTAIRSFVISK